MPRWLLLPLACLVACAQPVSPTGETAVVATAPVARMPPTIDRTVVLAPAATAEPAPLPNRAIEAPRDRRADSLNPSLEPMVLPTDRPQGFTFDNDLPRDTGRDRPFENLVQGARLRIPFE
jgi:hypothetical protein